MNSLLFYISLKENSFANYTIFPLQWLDFLSFYPKFHITMITNDEGWNRISTFIIFRFVFFYLQRCTKRQDDRTNSHSKIFFFEKKITPSVYMFIDFCIEISSATQFSVSIWNSIQKSRWNIVYTWKTL